jgi:hypothetical protein
MERRIQSAQAAALAVLMSGCASMPDVAIKYYFPKAETQLQVTQTLACTKDAAEIISVASVSQSTTYSSDRAVPRGQLRYKDVAGMFSDGDLAVSLADDGRLVSVNSSSTGQGGAFVKDFIALAAMVVKPAGWTGDPPRRDVKKICGVIDNFGAGKPVSLQFGAKIHYVAPYPERNEMLTIDPNSRVVYDALTAVDAAPSFLASIKVSEAESAASLSSDDFNRGFIELNDTAIATVTVGGIAPGSQESVSVWTNEIPIPLTTHYRLPLPTAGFFGKQTFAISLSGAGAIQKLQYGTAGAAEGADAAVALAKALIGPTNAEKAAALKAEADLIAQQQRLAQCQANPSACK